jgi:uncharacterized protein RhaS with RHS repeats
MPTVGRWLTPDPLGFTGGPNLYTYVHNHPLAYVDPDGQFAFLLAPLALSLAAEYCLPAACAYLGQYAGGALAASFLTGVLTGYNGSVTTLADSSFYSMEGADPSSFFLNRAGALIGTAISCMPQSRGVSAAKATANIAARELAEVATTTVVAKAQSCFNRFATATVHNATASTVKKTAQLAEAQVAKRGMPSLDTLSKAGQVMDRNGLTMAGRALAKHGNRPGSVFPRHVGRASDKNALGQFHLDDILTHPQTYIKPNKFEGYNFYAPDGRGACFEVDGTLRGFLQP